MKSCDKLWKAIEAILLVVGGTVAVPAAAADWNATTESIVTIYGYPKSGSSQGTGFVISDQGLIATAYHVIQDSKSVEVLDHKKTVHKDVYVEWVDPERDVAVISVTTIGNLPSLKMAKALPAQTQETRVAGSPRGLPKQILSGTFTSNGYVSSLAISTAGGKSIFAKDIDVLPIDVTIYGGMSGAPVLALDGTVVGILSGSYDQGRGIGWAIPAKYLATLMSTPAHHKTLDQIASWPNLSLMSTSWVSLKRSYSKKFTARELARLEALEGALRDLHGTWAGQSDSRETVYDHALGRCNKVMRTEASVTLESLDADESRLSGYHRLKSSTHIEFVDKPQSFDSDDMRTFRQQACNEQVFGDKTQSEIEVEVGGPLYLSAPTSSGTGTTLLSLPVIVNVTECDIPQCPAEVYGKQEAGNLEVISEAKVRWANTILTK